MTLKQKAYNDVVNHIFYEALEGKEYSKEELNRMICYSIAINSRDKRILKLKTDWRNKEKVKKDIVREYTNESTLRIAGNIKRSFDNTNERYKEV